MKKQHHKFGTTINNIPRVVKQMMREEHAKFVKAQNYTIRSTKTIISRGKRGVGCDCECETI